MPNHKQANHQAKKGAVSMTILQYALLGLLISTFVMIGGGISIWVSDKVEEKLDRSGVSVDTTSFVTVSAAIVTISVYAGTIIGIVSLVVGK